MRSASQSAEPAAAPARTPPRPSRRSTAAVSSDPALTVVETATERERLPHSGTVIDFRIGTLGCRGGFCDAGRHDTKPGLRLDGFIGRNIRGWVEIGFGGGWGTIRPQITPGTNALLLYGLDPNVLSAALLAQSAGLHSIDLAGLAVNEAELRSMQAGPSLRVHFIPRGRVDAFVGSGVGYNLLRARYQTAIGTAGFDFHGIEVPVQANLSVYVHRNIAMGVQFDYMWTWYGLGVLNHPQQRLPLPVAALDSVGAQVGADFSGDLPQFWTLGFALRGRL